MASVLQPSPRTSRAEGWELEEIADLGALARLAEEWRRLWERCALPHCFARPEWMLPWMRHFYRGGKIWTVALRRAGRLAGLAPLFLHGHARDRAVRQVSFIGAGISDYLEFLAEPGTEDRAAALILQHLRRNRDRWDLCDLQELPPGSALRRAAIPAGLDSERMSCGICPVLELPSTEAEFHQSLHGRFKNLRRTLRQLEQIPEIEIDVAGGEYWQQHLEDLIRLHGARWRERGEPGMLADSDRRAFHFEVAEGFAAAGMLRFYVMRRRGETISVWYGFAARGRYYFYLGGFDPQSARLSPGQVLLAHSMVGAIREGAREYDFLRKTEDFKHRWGAADRVNQRLLLWHAGSRLPAGFPESSRAERERL